MVDYFERPHIHRYNALADFVFVTLSMRHVLLASLTPLVAPSCRFGSLITNSCPLECYCCPTWVQKCHKGLFFWEGVARESRSNSA